MCAARASRLSTRAECVQKQLEIDWWMAITARTALARPGRRALDHVSQKGCFDPCTAPIRFDSSRPLLPHFAEGLPGDDSVLHEGPHGMPRQAFSAAQEAKFDEKRNLDNFCA